MDQTSLSFLDDCLLKEIEVILTNDVTLSGVLEVFDDNLNLVISQKENPNSKGTFVFIRGNSVKYVRKGVKVFN